MDPEEERAERFTQKQLHIRKDRLMQMVTTTHRVAGHVRRQDSAKKHQYEDVDVLGSVGGEAVAVCDHSLGMKLWQLAKPQFLGHISRWVRVVLLLAMPDFAPSNALDTSAIQSSHRNFVMRVSSNR